MRTQEEIKKERDVYNKRETDMFTIIYLKLLELELNQVELLRFISTANDDNVTFRG